MKTTGDNIFNKNRLFAWVALATAILLLIPAIAMQYTDQVSWTIADFVVGGALVFGVGSLFVLVARRVPRERLLATGVFFALALCYMWAELAVGVFTGLGD